jgi:hypothetical protein
VVTTRSPFCDFSRSTMLLLVLLSSICSSAQFFFYRFQSSSKCALGFSRLDLSPFHWPAKFRLFLETFLWCYHSCWFTAVGSWFLFCLECAARLYSTRTQLHFVSCSLLFLVRLGPRVCDTAFVSALVWFAREVSCSVLACVFPASGEALYRCSVLPSRLLCSRAQG